MSYTEDELREQLSQAEDLAPGPAKTATVEQIVAHADAAELEDVALEARIELINSYHQGNEPAKEFAVFGWCLTYWDAHADSIGPWEAEMLRWQYKWVVTSLTRFPTISLAQTQSALGDMEARYIRGGHSLHAVHSRRHSVAKHIGDLTEAGEQFRLWQAASRDENSDCEGCDPELKVQWLMDRDQDAEALELAQSVLSGRLTCREQPASMLEVVMLGMARLGRIDDARSAHLRSYRAQRGDRDNLEQIGSHLRFLALTGNEARGLEVLERHIGWIDTPRDPMSQMLFAAGAARLLSAVASLGHASMTVHRPASEDRPAGSPTVSDLQTAMTEMALGLAAQFDRRNASTTQSDRVTQLLAEATTNPVPLDTPGIVAQRAAAHPASAGDLLPGAHAAVARAQDYHDQGRDLEAAELLERYLPAFDDSGSNHDATAGARAQLLLGHCLAALDETESAATHFAGAIEALGALQLWPLVADAAMDAGIMFERTWNPSSAAGYFAQAVDAYDRTDQAVFAARAARREAKSTALIDIDDGRGLYAAALERIRALPSDIEVDRGWETADWNDDFAWSLWNADLNEEAMQYAQAAERGYADSNDAAGAGRAALSASKLVAERQQWQAARQHASRALETFQRAGLADLVDQARTVLGGLPNAI